MRSLLCAMLLGRENHRNTVIRKKNPIYILFQASKDKTLAFYSAQKMNLAEEVI